LIPYSHHIEPRSQKKTRGLFLLAFCFASAVCCAQTPSTASQVKAVFLFNFAHFVTWPSSSFAGASSPFVIGILGSDPFEAYLEKVIEGETIEGHPIVVQHFKDISEIRQCHILFINRDSPPETLHQLNQRSILTVGDRSSFIKEGGMIGFSLENNKIRFQINARTAKVANLSISSKLLRLADVIDK
jgi:hypothetical protein